ncbi:hypothetical protein HDV00_008104 [Rhizophlyctis rosea]|nr:hypothetical protein HDV00_008104 [Rhizophlyctis rosea]
MADLEDLQKMFEAFCSFGSSKNLASSGSMTDLSGPQMDGAKFAKFCRDNKLITKTLTSTDVDIIFNKVKPKGARKIDWQTFLEALRLVGEKKTGKKGDEAFDTVVGQLLRAGKGPVSSGTVPQNDAVIDRMTDTSMYTGTHKLRFDAEGHGRGLEGRDQPSKTNDLSKITNRDEQASVRGIPASADPAEKGKKRGHGNVVTASSEHLDLVASKPKKTGTTSNRASSTNLAPKNAGGTTKPTTAGKTYSTVKTTPKTGGSSSSVFNRLTDSSGYTGTHKERFNADGSGRGLAGRDSPSKGAGPGQYRGGDVKDLSQILRS